MQARPSQAYRKPSTIAGSKPAPREAVKPGKHYAAHPKWPRSRPINTKGFAAGCGIRGHLLDALHKACRAADLTTSGGIAIVVMNEPRVETRVAAGFPPFLLRAWSGIYSPYPETHM